ncbi:MAG: helicase-related protein, partial [Candidatus Limnocylindrus sp.]
AWCETNYEQDAFVAHVPGCIDVRGNMKADEKAEKLIAFTDEGGVIVTKPKIAGMGLNWQHAARMVFIGGSYSYEAFYQAIRRCWRFGQTREVVAHVIMATTEASMWNAIQRKACDHEDMKEMMFKTSKQAAVSHSARGDYNPTHYASIPRWLATK